MAPPPGARSHAPPQGSGGVCGGRPHTPPQSGCHPPPGRASSPPRPARPRPSCEGVIAARPRRCTPPGPRASVRDRTHTPSRRGHCRNTRRRRGVTLGDGDGDRPRETLQGIPPPGPPGELASPCSAGRSRVRPAGRDCGGTLHTPRGLPPKADQTGCCTPDTACAPPAIPTPPRMLPGTRGSSRGGRAPSFRRAHRRSRRRPSHNISSGPSRLPAALQSSSRSPTPAGSSHRHGAPRPPQPSCCKLPRGALLPCRQCTWQSGVRQSGPGTHSRAGHAPMRTAGSHSLRWSPRKKSLGSTSGSWHTNPWSQVPPHPPAGARPGVGFPPMGGYSSSGWV